MMRESDGTFTTAIGDADSAACALQYVFLVDDPSVVSTRVESLVSEFDRELRDIHSDSGSLTAAQAYARISAVIAQFEDLKNGLDDRTDEQRPAPGG
jgi:hypothetical protein